MAKKVLIKGMSCGGCVNKATKALKELGLENVNIDLTTKTAVVEGNVLDEDIKAVIKKVGFEVVGIEEV
ncbi:MAG: putative heavy-metal binding protein [Clostridiales bacterium]|jgi:copper chaperone CopZ|nr:putative heavy-metal binding protein [Clostridiales bacterium]